MPNELINVKEELLAKIERNKLNGWEDLDPKRKAFAMRYVVDYDHRKAAGETSFSADSGIKLIREPLLSAFISELQEQTAIANIITEDFVRTQWLNLIPALMGDINMPMGVDKDGVQIEAAKFYPAELNNLLKEMAKTTKIYDEGSGHGTGTVNVQINVGDLIGEDNVRIINPDE